MTNCEKNKGEIKRRVGSGEKMCKVIHELRTNKRDCSNVYCGNCEKASLYWLLAEYEDPKDNGWHDLRENPNDLPMENKEVLLEIDGFLFKYVTGVLFDRVWKSIVNLDNQSRVIRWKEIEE